MQFPISVGDQQAYHNLVDESVVYIEGLSQKLAQTYDELYSQNVDLEDLGSATEALIFAAEKLKDQKIKLEAYRQKLREEITSELGSENK